MTHEVMQNAALVFWPIFSLILFSVACFVMVLWTFRSGSGDLYRRLGSLALEDATNVLRVKE